jgi:hypothetical protein
VDLNISESYLELERFGKECIAMKMADKKLYKKIGASRAEVGARRGIGHCQAPKYFA